MHFDFETFNGRFGFFFRAQPNLAALFAPRILNASSLDLKLHDRCFVWHGQQLGCRSPTERTGHDVFAGLQSHYRSLALLEHDHGLAIDLNALRPEGRAARKLNLSVAVEKKALLKTGALIIHAQRQRARPATDGRTAGKGATMVGRGLQDPWHPGLEAVRNLARRQTLRSDIRCEERRHEKSKHEGDCRTKAHRGSSRDQAIADPLARTRNPPNPA